MSSEMSNTKHKEETVDQIKFLLKTVYYAQEKINQMYEKELAPAGDEFGVFYHIACAESPISVCVGNKSKLFTGKDEGAWKICIYCKQDIIKKTEDKDSKLNWR